MIWLIAKKEIHSNILTFRFLVGLILSLVLITASVFVLTKDHKIRLGKYNDNIRGQGRNLESRRTYSQIRAGASKSPSPLGFLCIGSEKELGDTVWDISYQEVPRDAAGQGGGNPLMSVFPSLDISLIIMVVLSLLALMLSYDAISGERERGTLAVTLSNPAPRHDILLGKLLGGMISIALPLILSLLVGVLVVMLSGAVILSAHVWLRIGLIFIYSMIYLSAIFMLGILVSSVTSRSATSLVILLFIWVISVMILPNMAPYAAKHIRRVEDRALIDAKREALNSEFWGETYRYGRELIKMGKFPPNLWRFMDASIISGDNPYPKIVRYAPRENMLWYLEGLKHCVPLHMEYAERIWELYRSYEQKLQEQLAVSDNISRISPAWTYYNALSILAGTDCKVYTQFMAQVRLYRQQLINYIQNKGGFSSISFFTPMKMDETLTYAKLEEMESTQGVEAIKKMQSRYWANARLLKDIPAFRYKPEMVTESINRTLPDALILILLNVIFFMMAYVSFMRREVK
jgi:ABC-type transport system involved in multi-copper enzyme maturation permease subunit